MRSRRAIAPVFPSVAFPRFALSLHTVEHPVGSSGTNDIVGFPPRATSAPTPAHHAPMPVRVAYARRTFPEGRLAGVLGGHPFLGAPAPHKGAPTR